MNTISDQPVLQSTGAEKQHATPLQTSPDGEELRIQIYLSPMPPQTEKIKMSYSHIRRDPNRCRETPRCRS